jgi:DNA invertase Pin-like site-specific DNA recombinase
LVRVSDDAKQDRQSQIEAIEAWLKLHNLEVQEFYLDAGPRDLPHKRAEFKRLIADVEAGKWNWVIISARDRFGVANNWQRGRYICSFRESDTQLWSCIDGELTSADAITTILGAVGSAQSSTEQRDKSERSLRGQMARAKRNESRGGVPAYGHDWACVGPDGIERWRLFYTGPFERQKVYLDGRVEHYNGQGNTPARDKGEILRLVPSQDKDRIAWARKIFEWYRCESISINAIAKRLNDLGVPSYSKEGWYSSYLSKMLRNPAYVEGCSVWNKRGSGRFLEHRNGAFQPVERVKDRVKAGRKRDQADWVMPEDRPGGIIDRETWDAVQLKLAAGTHNRAPRSSDLYLSGLVVCGHCDQRLAGWTQKSEKQPLSYVCNTYRKFGKKNAAGCRLHKVAHPLLVNLVEQYLEEAGIKLATVLSDQVGGQEWVRAISSEQFGRVREYLQTLEGMRSFVEHIRGEATEMEIDGETYDICDVRKDYRAAWEANRDNLQALLDEKQAELQGLARSLARLKSEVAIEATEREMEALGVEIEKLQGQLQPLDERADTLRAELARCSERVAEAREAVKGESGRLQAEALQKVLARIVCHFEHRREKKQDRSILVRVDFEPVVGEVKTLRPGTQPGPG